MKTTINSARFMIGCLAMIVTSACSGADGELEGDSAEVGATAQALTGCSLGNAVTLRGPNIRNRVGSNACVAVISPLLPSWWQYSDGAARVQIANHSDEPGENAFPLTVEWENSCGTESGTVTYTQSWEQHELGHPSAECSIVIKLGGNSTEDVLVAWGA